MKVFNLFPLTILQKIPVTAAVMVSIPHPLAEYDVNKCTYLFKHLNVPVIGTIMNQTTICCPNCQTDIPLFPQESKNVLGEIPFKHTYQEYANHIFPEYTNIALNLTQLLTTLPIATDDILSRVVVHHTTGE